MPTLCVARRPASSAPRSLLALVALVVAIQDAAAYIVFQIGAFQTSSDDIAAQFGPPVPRDGQRGIVAAVTERCEALAAPGPGIVFIALLPSACVPTDSSGAQLDFQQQTLDAQGLGATAVVFYSHANYPMALNATADAQQPDIPAASVGHRIGLACASAASSGYGCQAFIMPGPRSVMDSVGASVLAAVIVLVCFLAMVAIVQRQTAWALTHQHSPNVGLSGKQIDALPVVLFAPLPQSPSGNCAHCGAQSCPHSAHADPHTAAPCATPPDGPPPGFTRSRSCSGATEAVDIAALQRPHGGSFKPALSAIAGSLGSAAPSDSFASTHMLGSARRGGSSLLLRAAAQPMASLRGAGSVTGTVWAGARPALAGSTVSQPAALAWQDLSGRRASPVAAPPAATQKGAPDWRAPLRHPGLESFGMHSSAAESVSVGASQGQASSSTHGAASIRAGPSLRSGRARQRCTTHEEESESLDVPLLPVTDFGSVTPSEACASPGMRPPPIVIGFRASHDGDGTSGRGVGAIAARDGPGPDATPFVHEAASPGSAGSSLRPASQLSMTLQSCGDATSTDAARRGPHSFVATRPRPTGGLGRSHADTPGLSTLLEVPRDARAPADTSDRANARSASGETSPVARAARAWGLSGEHHAAAVTVVPRRSHDGSDAAGAGGVECVGRKSSVEGADSPRRGAPGWQGGATRFFCVVCLQDYEHGDVVKILPCNHRFHAECIDQWLHAHCLCPICKHNAAQPWQPSLSCAEQPAAPGPSLSHLWTLSTRRGIHLMRRLVRRQAAPHASPAEFATRTAFEGAVGTMSSAMQRRHSAAAAHFGPSPAALQRGE